MSYFDIKYNWIPVSDGSATELTATLACLQLFLGKNNITEHRPPTRADELQIPVFYLAEWIIENWWVLLFEPRKHEEEEDPEFLSRHSLLAAQHGFPLPALSIIPLGQSIGFSCSPRRTPFANVQFTADAFGGAPREEVQETFAKFLEDVVRRLETQGFKDTPLAQMWREMRALSDDEKKFCELVGSLGVSPEDVTDALTEAVEKIYNTFGERAVRDFCLAATESQVLCAANSGEELNDALKSSPASELTPLFGIRLPSDNYSAPSWRRGLQAAKNVREKFHIKANDLSGADKIFESLRIDTSKAIHLHESNDLLPFTGAIDREDSVAKIVLLQEEEHQRRFAAGRAAYLAWASEERSRRLITNAVTRDQQASRQFAAEILIPRGYLEGLSGGKRKLRPDQIYEAARQRRVTPQVVFWQARNAGIVVSAI